MVWVVRRERDHYRLTSRLKGDPSELPCLKFVQKAHSQDDQINDLADGRPRPRATVTMTRLEQASRTYRSSRCSHHATQSSGLLRSSLRSFMLKKAHHSRRVSSPRLTSVPNPNSSSVSGGLIPRHGRSEDPLNLRVAFLVAKNNSQAIKAFPPLSLHSSFVIRHHAPPHHHHHRQTRRA